MLSAIGNSKYSLVSAWLVVAISAAFYSYDILLRIAPSVMKLDLMTHYGISAASLSGITAMYYLVYAPMQLPVGMLMDRYGPRLLLTASGLVCVIGISILPLTNWVSMAVLSRFLVGLGSSFAFVGVLKLGSVMLPSNRFALVSGLALAAGMLGGSLGDVVIANLLTVESWHDVCYQAAIVGVVLTILMLALIPQDMHKQDDTLEEVNFYQILEGKLALIKNPQIWLLALVGGLSYTPLTLFAEHFGIEFLQLKYGISHVQASALNSYLFLGWTIGGPLVCGFSDYVGSRKVVILSGLVISFFFCIAMLYLNVPVYLMPLLMICFGIVNSAQIIVFPAAKEIAGKEYTASAVALINMICMFSGVMQGLIGYLYDYTRWVLIHTHQLDRVDLISYRVAYITLPIFLLCAIIAMIWVRETYEADSIHD